MGMPRVIEINLHQKVPHFHFKVNPLLNEDLVNHTASNRKPDNIAVLLPNAGSANDPGTPSYTAQRKQQSALLQVEEVIRLLSVKNTGMFQNL